MVWYGAHHVLRAQVDLVSGNTRMRALEADLQTARSNLQAAIEESSASGLEVDRVRVLMEPCAHGPPPNINCHDARVLEKDG